MISCGEAEEFIPFGREHMVHHPGEIGLAPSNPSPPELDHIEILKELNTVSLNSSKDWWAIRKSKDGLTEEELYFSGKTVVWSRGQMGLEGSKAIIKSMTCDSRVLQAFFATFYTYPDLPALVGDEMPDKPTGIEIPSICIVEKDYLTVYTEAGEDFFIAPPFTVRKVWPMKFGIILERQVTPAEIALPTDGEENLPILYSLLHPLDEINPVLLKKDKFSSSIKQTYAKDHQQLMVSTHLDPSICILHTSFSSAIKICKIRRATQEENMTLLQTSILGTGVSGIGTPLTSLTAAPPSLSQSHSCSHSQSHLPSPNIHHISSHTPTPTSTSRTRPSTISGHQQSPKRFFTPQSHMAAFNRNPSPSFVNCQQMRLGLSPSPARSTFGSKLSKGLHSHSVLNDTVVDPEPLIPDICLEVLWSGTCSARPTTAFLTEDNIGQKFICLLFPQTSSLKCYRYELKMDNSSIIIGPETNLRAKDAVPLTGLKMMVVVDASNSLMLYTGVVHVCRLHLAGLSTLNSTLFKDFSYLNISSKLNSPLGTPMRRWSLLTSSRPPSSLDIKFEAELSPVLTDKVMLEGSFLDDPALPLSSAIVCVRDATDFRLTLEHTSGNFYRVTLPSMWSSTLVEKSLIALKYILPKELGLQLLNKWYTNRNTPGNGNFSSSSEWHLFSKTVLSQIGYDVEKLSPSGQLDLSGSASPLIVSKKFRATESGSESDWEYLLSSAYHQALGNNWSEVLQLDHLEVVQGVKELSPGIINTSAPFFTYLPGILFALHLVYEELKANTLHWDLTSLMIPCLTQLAADLRASLYLDHYWKDYPHLCSLQGPSTQLSMENTSKLCIPDYFSYEPPSLYAHLYSIMKNIKCSPFPCIPSVSTSTKTLTILYQVAATNTSISDIPIHKFLSKVNPSSESLVKETSPDLSLDLNETMSTNELETFTIHEKIVMMTDQLGLTLHDIKVMAPGLSLILMNAQHVCRTYPPQNWPASVYQLIDRPDLVAQKQHAERYKQMQKKNKSNFRKRGRDPYNIKVYSQNEEEMEPNSSNKATDNPKEEEDGMETLNLAMLALRWPEDQRVGEVCKMLCSSRPVTINITQRPGVSDHDFLEEQERQLYALSIRTMALPMGRGMFTLCTHSPIITEALPIPSLNLKGKAPPRGTTIDFPINEVPADMDMWPLFHNGVGAGLKIAPNCGEITSTWIVYNKSKGDASVGLSHAGFLMALGLNGHLRNFATVSLHDYLSQGHELSCVGLLLGISAAMRGTMDTQTTKVLSVHLECLLPPTSTELDVPHTVQVAAILGVGLVYADTGHRHMAEVLLQEIGRPPGPEMENSTDRESYSLAAGLALGLVMFGRGAEMATSSDLNLAGELHHYIEGGHRKPLSGVMREKYKSPSYQIKEGDRVNINVTSPGATLALGMIYFRSGSKAIADWMVVPNTPYMLDQVRPDFLLLRTIARGLILWDEVMPTYKWVEGHVPTTILQHVHRSGNQSTPGVDYESIHQAYYNILAGACFVLGLKFAGSANSEAFYVLWKYTRMFTNFTKRSIAELAGKATIETCLCSILLSLSMVMAGTGDLEVLRLIRFLRSRVGITVSTVGYGSHVAIHMALGFLFLGGGRFSLGTSNIALASLIISCFPKFPTHSNDNRYHLQAFRHLYVLASEPRLFLPIDVDTGKLRIAKILLRFSDTKCYKDQQYVAKAPHMLPELSKLKEIIVEGDVENPRYWPVRFSKGTESWHMLEALLSTGSGILLKLKEGRFPYGESPISYDYKSSYLLTQEKSSHWTIKRSILKEVFGCSSDLIDSLVGKEAENALDVDTFDHQKNDEELLKTLTTLIYDYLSIGKPETINNWVNALQAIRKVCQFNYLSGLLIWQIKLISACSSFLHNLGTSTSTDFFSNDKASPRPSPNCSKMDLDEVPVVVEPSLQPLVSSERAISLSKRLELLVDSWEKEVKDELGRYFSGDSTQGFSPKCAFTLMFKDVPPIEKLSHFKATDHPLALLQQFRGQKCLKSVISVAKEMLLKSSNQDTLLSI